MQIQKEMRTDQGRGGDRTSKTQIRLDQQMTHLVRDKAVSQLVEWTTSLTLPPTPTLILDFDDRVSAPNEVGCHIISFYYRQIYIF